MSFGNLNEPAKPADLITDVAFDSSGRFGAVSDNSGRVILFETCYKDKSTKGLMWCRHVHEFQSHWMTMDPLRNVEIPERINAIKWLPRKHKDRHLLTTNDTTIKLFKIRESREPSGPNNIPRLIEKQRCDYDNAHTTGIHTLSLNSDGMTFLSADSLRLNIWQFESKEPVAFNILELQPPEETPVETTGGGGLPTIPCHEKN